MSVVLSHPVGGTLLRIPRKHTAWGWVLELQSCPGGKSRPGDPSCFGASFCSCTATHAGPFWPSDPFFAEGRSWLQCEELPPTLWQDTEPAASARSEGGSPSPCRASSHICKCFPEENATLLQLLTKLLKAVGLWTMPSCQAYLGGRQSRRRGHWFVLCGAVFNGRFLFSGGNRRALV